MFDGLRLPADGGQGPVRESAAAKVRRTTDAPERAVATDPEAALRKARTDALIRHARAVDAIFGAEDAGGKRSPDQMRKLSDARKAFEGVRPHGWRDAEAAYVKEPGLAREAGAGKVNRAIRALQLETEIRTDPQLRADRFVERWQKLDRASQHQYRAGNMTDYKATRSAMGDMAKSLERDAQMESLLRPRARELGLGIGMEPERGLSRELSDWFGLSRGRGVSR